jgi:hypothetical protein
MNRNTSCGFAAPIDKLSGPPLVYFATNDADNAYG